MSHFDKGGIRTIDIEGPIGETSEFFLLPLFGLKEIHLNLEKATYMNSVGVKHWVNWAAKVPPEIKVILKKGPHIIANQASMVVGFLPKHFLIESFFAHFVCPSCELEVIIELRESEHFKRTSGEDAHWYKLPQPSCSKCPTETKLETDFFPEKLFAFLKRADS
ncbi:MAG: hypothetical protein SGJ18_14025 [Pseudomonadota bacterium]|nr:hypothetical protein [Pseudomonadota bacterium]